jgi:predicted SnoaL-like aldol condensation-catalyzing enzyme
MATENNNPVVERFWQEVFKEENLDVADELFASDHVLHVPDLPAEERGPYAIKDLVAIFHKALPSIQLDLQDEIAAEDKVVSRWTARGPLADELKIAGASDDEETISGISIFRVSGGKIKETWHQFEVLRDESEALKLPEEVQERWLGNDQRSREILEDHIWLAGIICRLCRCC